MWRHKTHTAINLVGLTSAFVVVFLIAMLVKDELSWDRHHSKAGRTYRVIAKYNTDGGPIGWAIGEHKRAPLMKTDFPDFEAIARLGVVAPPVRYKDKVFQEDRFFIADPEIFGVFDIPMVSGDPSAALTEPQTVILSESAAKKYFEDGDPIGETIDIGVPLKITGVFRDMPRRSHFHADFICSMGTDKAIYPQIVFDNWGELSMYTYVVLPHDASAKDYVSRLESFIVKHIGEEDAKVLDYELQPLTRIHLETHRSEIEANGDAVYLYVFSTIALATLLIAGINYMNLTTARSSLRAKEVGIRKTVGAGRRQLMGQFFGESLVFAVVSFLLAWPIVDLCLPLFQQVSNRIMSISDIADPSLVLGLFSVALIIGLLSGIYPAMFLSSFSAIRIMKGEFTRGVRGAALRKTFVTAQFTVSVALIAGAVVIHDQLAYVERRPLGYTGDHLLNVPLSTRDVRRKYDVLKNEMSKAPGVLSVARSSKSLGGRLTSNLGFRSENIPEGLTSMQAVAVDHDFFKTIGATIVEGRNFSQEFPSDADEAFILNEAAVRAFQWTSAVGKRFETVTLDENTAWQPKKGRVIGVVKDFHYEPLQKKIVSVMFYISSNWGGQINLRLDGRQMSETIKSLEGIWKRHFPNLPFQYTFVDDRIASAYESQKRLGQLVTAFAGFAILIACLGLFGLASFAVDRRTKEIGVRKVMGATVASIVTLVSKEFLLLVMLSIAVAVPPAIWVMNRWLEEFAYRMDIGPMTFVWAGLIAVAIAALTVGSRAYRASQTNPVEALRYE